MSKLYILNNKKGLVKIGITNKSVKERLSKINKSIPQDFHFYEIASFNVENNVAKIESIIHDFLNQSLLNIYFLKEKINFIEFDSILNNRTTGYTEIFLGNSILIKNIFSFLGYSGLIDVKDDDIDKINSINCFNFKDLYEKYSNETNNLSIEDMHKTTNKIKNNPSYSIHEKIKLISLQNDLSITSNNGELLIKNKNISISNNDLLSLNDHELKKLLSEKSPNISKNQTSIKAIMESFHEKNQKYRVQPNLSLRKEIKREEFEVFFDYDKRLKIKKILDIYENDILFPGELIFTDVYKLKERLELHGSFFNSEDQKIILPNFNVKNSDFIFSKYRDALTDKYDFLDDSCDENRNQKIAYCLGYIFKSIYDSKNKDDTFNQLINVMTLLHDYACLYTWGSKTDPLLNEKYKNLNSTEALKNTISDVKKILDASPHLHNFLSDFLLAMDSSINPDEHFKKTKNSLTISKKV